MATQSAAAQELDDRPEFRSAPAPLTMQPQGITLFFFSLYLEAVMFGPAAHVLRNEKMYSSTGTVVGTNHENSTLVHLEHPYLNALKKSLMLRSCIKLESTSDSIARNWSCVMSTKATAADGLRLLTSPCDPSEPRAEPRFASFVSRPPTAKGAAT